MVHRKLIWSWPTRLLHLLIALAVTHQLVVSLVMVVPDDKISTIH